MLVALATLQAPAFLAAIQDGSSDDHHHPGCPWETRNEPCPHRADPPAAGESAWAPCPPMETLAPLALGPDVGPRAEEVALEVERPVARRIAAAESPFAQTPSPRPDPHPPRVPLLAR